MLKLRNATYYGTAWRNLWTINTLRAITQPVLPQRARVLKLVAILGMNSLTGFRR